MRVWRSLPLLEAPGQFQMALDTWLLEQHRLGRQPSLLRFYTWSRPTLSLGYHQRQWPEQWNQLPVDRVRRPTGGRAVLHQGDLTYAVITSQFQGDRTQTYQRLCEFLIQGFRQLGIELHYGQAGRGYIHNPNCFGTATAADLVLASGVKLIGSAQLRRGQALLQHGSIRLQPDPQLFEQVFGPGEPLPELGELMQQLPRLIQVLSAAAETCFGMTLENQPLSDQEQAAVLAQVMTLRN